MNKVDKKKHVVINFLPWVVDLRGHTIYQFLISYDRNFDNLLATFFKDHDGIVYSQRREESENWVTCNSNLF